MLDSNYYSIPNFKELLDVRPIKKIPYPYHRVSAAFLLAPKKKISFWKEGYVDFSILSFLNYPHCEQDLIEELYRVLQSSRHICAFVRPYFDFEKKIDTLTSIRTKFSMAGFEEVRSFIIPIKLYKPDIISDYKTKSDYIHLLVFKKGEFPRQEISLTKEQRQLSLLSPSEVDVFFKAVWTDCTLNEQENGQLIIPVSLYKRVVNMFSYIGEAVLDLYSEDMDLALASISTGRSYLGLFDCVESLNVSIENVKNRVFDYGDFSCCFETILDPYK